mmetsp:Transcript_38176/g.107872  ORF Transcript_38176/g.107872 Transcript_38176/m.107872 type:complete len:83 (+) Transcript_38176:311-559(+)
MGKRKSSKPPPAKKKAKLDKQFTCPFCNHEKSVNVKLDYKSKRGEAKCNMCSEIYNCGITPISEEIDVYSDWIDACEKVNSG